MGAVAACTLCGPVLTSELHVLWFTFFTQFITGVAVPPCVARFVFHCASSENEKNC